MDAVNRKGAFITLSSMLLIFALIGIYAIAFNQSEDKQETANELTALSRLQEIALNTEFNMESLVYGNRDLNIDFNQGIVFFKQEIPLDANIPAEFDLNALAADANSYFYFVASEKNPDYDLSFDINSGLNALTFTVKPFNALVRQAIYPNLSRKGIDVMPNQIDFLGYVVRFRDENYSSIQGTINSGTSYYLKLVFDNNVSRYNVSLASSDFNVLTVSGKTINIKLNGLKQGSLSLNRMTNAGLVLWAGIDYSNQASMPWVENNLIDYNLSKGSTLLSKK